MGRAVSFQYVTEGLHECASRRSLRSGGTPMCCCRPVCCLFLSVTAKEVQKLRLKTVTIVFRGTDDTTAAGEHCKDLRHYTPVDRSGPDEWTSGCARESAVAAREAAVRDASCVRHVVDEE